MGFLHVVPPNKVMAQGSNQLPPCSPGEAGREKNALHPLLHPQPIALADRSQASGNPVSPAAKVLADSAPWDGQAPTPPGRILPTLSSPESSHTPGLLPAERPPAPCRGSWQQPCLSRFPHILLPDGFENIPKLLLAPLLFLSSTIVPPPSPPSKDWMRALRGFHFFFNISTVKG